MLLVVLIELSPADAFLPTDGFPVGVVGADQPLLQLLLVELDVLGLSDLSAISHKANLW